MCMRRMRLCSMLDELFFKSTGVHNDWEDYGNDNQYVEDMIDIDINKPKLQELIKTDHNGKHISEYDYNAPIEDDDSQIDGQIEDDSPLDGPIED